MGERCYNDIVARECEHLVIFISFLSKIDSKGNSLLIIYYKRCVAFLSVVYVRVLGRLTRVETD